MPKFKFQVWQPIGFVVVKANSKDEAEEKCEEFGLAEDGEDIEFDPYSDGQEMEFRFERKLKK